MSNIGIDATPVAVNRKGLPRFLHQLIIELSRQPTKHRYIVFVNERIQLPDLPQASHIVYCPVKIYSSLLWSTIQQPIALNRQKIDLLFICGDRIPLLYTGKIVHYLFELPGPRFELGKEIASVSARFSALVTKLWFPQSLNIASLIIVSSQATKDALIETYHIQNNKLKLIYPGRDVSFSPGGTSYDKNVMRQRLGAPSGYVFHISSVNDKRDNTSVALRAFHAALPHIPVGTKLVIGGKADPERQGLMPLIHELGLDDHLTWTGFIPDKDMADTYRSAELYLDTSLYEGFGLQVLEAMSCGTPVVCSNASSLPEVAGDAAITADPNNIADISDGIVKALTSERLHREMVEKGLLQAQRFDWSATLRLMENAFDALLESR